MSGPGPEVTITLPYDEALRLSYMARFAHPIKAGDREIAEKVDAAIRSAEDAA